jgi:DNA polymerase-3 subunit chi
MTQVEFHTGVADTVHFACRLLRKAHRQQAAVLVTAPAATLDALDRQLWTFAPHEFVPHCRIDRSGAAMQRLSPIWLSESSPPLPHPDIVVNIGSDMPDAPRDFSRVIEVLATDPQAAQAGRARWRAYVALGLAIEHHDAGAAS